MEKRTFFLGIGSLALLTLFVMMLSGPRPTSGQGSNNPCSIKVPKPEPTNLSVLAKITADQAMAAARAAYPGSRVQRVELENDNGYLVYGVSLSNGLEVKVDAGTGVVLHQEQEDSEDESQENLQAK
ncbi:MAG: PepSY domain-containing protein [Desulfobaccales bacterium]